MTNQRNIAPVFLMIALSAIYINVLSAREFILPDKKTRNIKCTEFIVEILKEKALPGQDPPPYIFSDEENYIINIKYSKSGLGKDFRIRPYDVEHEFSLISPHIILFDKDTRTLIFSWTLDNGRAGGAHLYSANIDTHVMKKISWLDASHIDYLVSPTGIYVGYGFESDSWPVDPPWSEMIRPFYWGAIQLKNGAKIEKDYTPPSQRPEYFYKLEWGAGNTLELKAQHKLRRTNKFSKWKTVDTLILGE